MLLDWFPFGGRVAKNLTLRQRERQSLRRRGRLLLERLEDRLSPSVSTFNIATDQLIPVTGGPAFIKGEHVQFNISVSSTNPNAVSSNQAEKAEIFSSLPNGFIYRVNVFSSQTLDYVVEQNGETFYIARTGADIIGTVSVFVESAGLQFVQQPTSAAANGTLAPVKVQVVDAQGHPNGSFNGNVTLTLGNNYTGAKLNDGNPITVQAQGGVATFSGLSINTPGNDYSLVATLDDGAQNTSGYF